ncbi:uncharacterized protein LOC131878462 [Tigriopus californicus]|uniref:uncharacterized protein LOC131878462 n=1 Tax=Tigriopus californicus TaxID=6832 RepID=UPI0027D9F37C|nr:uncharacterized protein LOC131878462 [Tigriopus californicus]
MLQFTRGSFPGIIPHLWTPSSMETVQEKAVAEARRLLSSIRIIGDEAEIGKMTVDEHHMFELIFACRHDTDLFVKLLELRDPTLEMVLSTATAFESARRIREQAVPLTTSVAAVIDQGACDRCGRTGHSRVSCPLRDVVCHECGKAGHLGRVCRQRIKSRERSSSRERPKFRESAYAHDRCRDGSRESQRGRDRVRRAPTPSHRDRGSRRPSSAYIPAVVDKTCFRSTPTIRLSCTFEKGRIQYITAIPDTGATRTLIPASKLPPDIMPQPSSTNLVAANGSSITNAGSISVVVSVLGGPTTSISAIVSPDLVGSMLISWHDLLALNIIPKNFPRPIPGGDIVRGVASKEIEVADTVDKIKADYTDVLVDSLGKASGTIRGPKMIIELDKSANVRPCKREQLCHVRNPLNRPHPLTLSKSPEVKRQDW